MAGRLVSRIWQSDPTIHAPAAHRRACSYDAFIPDELASLALRLDATLAGLISEAERAIKELNNEG
ncbi:MAG: Fic family protein, partial [Gemmatimonadaceae bacterium]